MMNVKDLNKDNRLIKSQQLLRDCFHEALGVYEAKEPKVSDSWRDMEPYQLWLHFLHEIEEIKRSQTKDRIYHNCLDAINLLGMIAVRTRDYKK